MFGGSQNWYGGAKKSPKKTTKKSPKKTTKKSPKKSPKKSLKKLFGGFYF